MTPSHGDATNESPRFLTAHEWQILTCPIRIELSYRVHHNGAWEDRPFVIDFDARPLAVLAESAALGHRLYEFMHLRRPGDLLRYWMVRAVEVGPEMAERLRRRLAHIKRRAFDPEMPLRALPFVQVDSCFWRQEIRWVDDDSDDLDRAWFQYRQVNTRPDELVQMLEVVRAVQLRVRSIRDPLLAHELALIDSTSHARDDWAYLGPVDYEAHIPATRSSIDSGLFELITSTAKLEEVSSVSCQFNDRILWRALVWEQIGRASKLGVAPEKAFALSGPDSGLTDAVAGDWGGDIHIPWEGAAGADLYVQPDWQLFDRDRALAAGSVRAGVAWRNAHRYAILRGDPGEFVHDVRVRCGDWTMYRLGAE